MMEVEMNDGINNFARAVWWGAVVGGGPFMLFTVPFGISLAFSEDLAGGLYLANLPLMIAGVGTLIGLLLIGLPLTAVLRWAGKGEPASTYSLAGLGAGFLIPYLIFAAATDWGSDAMLGGLFLSFPGALAGTTAATIWGNWRERVAAEIGDAAADLRPERGERWLR
jgi:hypothetical protein